MRERIRSAVRDPESAEAAYRRRINAMLEQIDLVVTDRNADQQIVKALKKAGVKIIVAE
jgi:DeoR/GlpR family transcriptional regulator of sugar metabolism